MDWQDPGRMGDPARGTMSLKDGTNNVYAMYHII